MLATKRQAMWEATLSHREARNRVTHPWRPDPIAAQRGGPQPEQRLERHSQSSADSPAKQRKKAGPNNLRRSSNQQPVLINEGQPLHRRIVSGCEARTPWLPAHPESRVGNLGNRPCCQACGVPLPRGACLVGRSDARSRDPGPGFSFQRVEGAFVGPQGIFKPALCQFPLSITTVPLVEGKQPPYLDHFSGSTLSYRYRGEEPNHRDNTGLRRAMEERLPLIYFFGTVPSQYLPVWPVFVVADDPDTLTFSVQVDEPAAVDANRPLVLRDEDARRSSPHAHHGAADAPGYLPSESPSRIPAKVRSVPPPPFRVARCSPHSPGWPSAR